MRKLWTCKDWSQYIDFECRSGLRLRFEKGIEPKIRQACMDFAKWLRKEYEFPIRVVIYFQNKEILTMPVPTWSAPAGLRCSAYFVPYVDKKDGAYICVAAGDWESYLHECDDDIDGALTGYFTAMTHELTCYFQWIKNLDNPENEQKLEQQAEYYAEAIVYDYIQECNPDYLNEDDSQDKDEILSVLRDAEGSYELLRCCFYYDEDVEVVRNFYIPGYSEDFVLGIIEDDFILNGFEIRKLSDLQSVEVKDDLCMRINQEQGILENLQIPEVDLTSGRSICESLLKWNEFVCIENECTNDDEDFLYMGELKSAESDYLVLRPIDADGIWEEERRIYYDRITCITLGDRYTSVWSEYIKNMEDNEQIGR